MWKVVFLRAIICIYWLRLCSVTANQKQNDYKSVIASRINQNEIDPEVSPGNVKLNITSGDAVLNPVEHLEETNQVNFDDANPINKYCNCTDTLCNCCRDLRIPLVPITGPGCAKIHFLGHERMTVTIKYGDIVLASRTISGANTRPVCISLPGGFTQFCGRVYGLSRQNENFKACLGLELRAEDDVEAALRVSCFKFGSKGLSVTEAEPLPPSNEKDDEEDDDFLDFGGDSDVDDYDDGDSNTDGGTQTDYDGISNFLGGLFGTRA